MILVEISIFSNFPVLIEQRHLTVVTFSQLSTRCLGLQGTVWYGMDNPGKPETRSNN